MFWIALLCGVGQTCVLETADDMEEGGPTEVDRERLGLGGNNVRCGSGLLSLLLTHVLPLPFFPYDSFPTTSTLTPDSDSASSGRRVPAVHPPTSRVAVLAEHDTRDCACLCVFGESAPVCRVARKVYTLTSFRLLFQQWFTAFDVPVYWPILVIYFFVLFTLTMRRQIQ